MPQWVNTPRSKGSLRRSETTISMAPVSSTAVRPMRTRGPVAMGPVPQRPRVGDLARQRLAPVEEGVAPLPGQTQELVEEDLAGIALSVAHDHRRAGEMRDIGVRKAAEHGGVQDGARGLRADGHV